MAEEHQYAERFALMWYACGDCPHVERIWNSRNGVTPFGLSCPSCGGHKLYHTNFREDEFAPRHELRKGQRFFRDGTPDEAVAIIERRFSLYEKSGDKIPEETRRRMLDDARNTTGEWNEGWPAVDVFNGSNHPPYVLRPGGRTA